MSLLDVFEHYGINPPHRNTGKILCPLDHETHPSCSVDLDKGVWRCHSCGEGGDDVTLIQLKEQIDVASALRRREEITGSSDRAVREATRPVSPISGKPGYQPRYKRVVPARARRHFAD